MNFIYRESSFILSEECPAFCIEIEKSKNYFIEKFANVECNPLLRYVFELATTC